MELHGQSPWYLHKDTLLRQGFGGLSAFSEIRRSSNLQAHDYLWQIYAFIHPAERGGLLRRRIKRGDVL